MHNILSIFCRKRDKLVGFAFKQLEKNFPHSAKGLAALKKFYSWATNHEEEFNLLKDIVKSLKV